MQLLGIIRPANGGVTNGVFNIDTIQICGLKTDMIPLPDGRLKSLAEAIVPDAMARLLTNRLGLGSFLVARMYKPGSRQTEFKQV